MAGRSVAATESNALVNKVGGEDTRQVTADGLE